MSIKKDTIKESDFVKSLEKGLLVISAFTKECPALTMSEAAKLTGLSRPATRRILLTLTHLGYLYQSDKNVFSLTPKILSLGHAYFASNSIWSGVTPHLEELSNIVQESTSISVLDGQEIVYVARVATQRIMSITLNVGSRLPAYATSMGQTLLAYMEPEKFVQYAENIEFKKFTANTPSSLSELTAKCELIRERGYNIAQQELENDLTSIAAPLFNRNNTVVAAINISMHSSKFLDINKIEAHYIQPLLKIAAEISTMIEHHQ
ncbi:IclR family transcriptional regulator C-terminal domain-containing protein [Metasolibacillus sp. FSL H7-0170]|uniref:IclR family transcriptional regulator domain-containing protein n=1 Tax=Metasolibacillus TaxID=2703677 RepID=UPI0007936CE5|nr:IclR family transcriptional regulator C-terminal domain-containing protein [Metasolibacillus fluoroglycofenilyticus]KYG89212.1 hypothetical protein A0U40_12790 [[Bacillus] sp. KCTC 13219]